MPHYRKYFVSYAFFTPDGQEGYGTAAVNRSTPVTGMKDVETMVEAIKKQAPQLAGVEIQVLNWRRFEADEA